MSDYYYMGLILRNLDLEEGVIKAWTEVNKSVITSLDCEGQNTKQAYYRRDDLPLFPSLSRLMDSDDEEQKLLFTLVKGQDVLQKMIEATQRVTGDLSQPGRGILFAWPLPLVIGLP